MSQRRSGASGPSPTDPAAARRRWSNQRAAHLQQVNAFTFLFPSRLKRSATKRPAALRYAEHLPASRMVRRLLVLAVLAYVGLQLSQDVPLGRAALLAVLFGLIVLVASTYRLAVGNAGISFDIAGLRQVSSFGFAPLYAIRAVCPGRTPEDWPRAELKGGWWPGRLRVSVLHLDDAGTLKAFCVWVSDPEAFGTALLGRPMSDQD